MARITLAGALALVVLSTSGDLSAQQPSTIQAAMRAKLAATQQLLESVVKADYAAIVRDVAPLSRISEAEIASWQSVDRPEYVQHASLFLLSVKGLREAAQQRNIDAVALEYTTLVSSCIRCHTYVGKSRAASLDLPADLLTLRLPGH